MAPQDCARNFRKRKQSDAEFARNSLLRMVIIDIVMNTLLGRVTRHPAGMHCPCWDDAFVSSCFCFLFLFVGHAPSPLLTYLPCVRGVHSSNTHCVAVYRPISTRFRSFFSEGVALSETLHSSHIRR